MSPLITVKLMFKSPVIKDVKLCRLPLALQANVTCCDGFYGDKCFPVWSR